MEFNFKHPYPGLFVVFEGPDGSGKSVQAIRARNFFAASLKQRVLLTKEPTKDLVGLEIRAGLSNKELLEKLGPKGFQSWYSLDSKFHVATVIKPVLQSGGVVTSDRYRPSMVYGADTAADIVSLFKLNAVIMKEYFIWPDKIFIFQVTEDVALERLKNKNTALDEFETAERIRKTGQLYSHFANLYPNCQLVDGMRSEKEVFKDVRSALADLIYGKFGKATLKKEEA